MDIVLYKNQEYLHAYSKVVVESNTDLSIVSTTPAEVQIGTSIAKFFQRIIVVEHWDNQTNITLMSI